MILKLHKENNWKFTSRVFWWKHKGQKKFEAVFIQGFGYTFWIFRNERIYNDWPNQK